MAKYIDAELLPSLFDKEYKGTLEMIKQGETHLNNIAEGFLEAYQVILKIPAADVRENVRGKWKHTVAFHVECSECGCTISANKGLVFFTHDSKYNFCPNCGADMRT